MTLKDLATGQCAELQLWSIDKRVSIPFKVPKLSHFTLPFHWPLKKRQKGRFPGRFPAFGRGNFELWCDDTGAGRMGESQGDSVDWVQGLRFRNATFLT
jgi:hypothetical protein